MFLHLPSSSGGRGSEEIHIEIGVLVFALLWLICGLRVVLYLLGMVLVLGPCGVLLWRGGASLHDELPVPDKHSSTLCLDKVVSIWSHGSDGAINIPQLRSQVLNCYLAANVEFFHCMGMFIIGTLSLFVGWFMYFLWLFWCYLPFLSVWKMERAQAKGRRSTFSHRQGHGEVWSGQLGRGW